jgi:hypothetical protein
MLWSASMADKRLPITFYKEIKIFLKGHKKELIRAHRDSNTDERAVNPMTFALYHLFLPWSMSLQAASNHPPSIRPGRTIPRKLFLQPTIRLASPHPQISGVMEQLIKFTNDVFINST